MSEKSLYHQCSPLICGRCLLFLQHRCKAISHHVPSPSSDRATTLPGGLGEQVGTWQANREENTPGFGLFQHKKTSQLPIEAMWRQAEDAQHPSRGCSAVQAAGWSPQ